MSTMSELMTVLQAILKRECEVDVTPGLNGNGMSLWDYQNLDQFSSLWNSVCDVRGTAIIVWEDTPWTDKFGSVDIHQHLTPLHWAVCASQQFKELGFKVWILDLAPTRHRFLPLLRAFGRYKPDEFPWLRILTPTECYSTSNVFKEICGAAAPSDAESSRALLDLAKMLMVGESKREDRHSLMNIIAPLMLMPDYLKNDPHARALRILIKSLGFDANVGTQEKDEILRDLDFEVVLIDDMARMGWSQWLEHEIREATGRKKIKLKSISSADEVLTEINTLAEDREERKLWFMNGEPRILFLDLRLFVPSDEAARHEEEFHRNLLLTAKRRSSKWRLPWKVPRTSQSWVTKETMIRAKARLILPKLLAQLDPLLPIVMFSSSTDSEVLKELAGFGNIITVFSKPVIYGASSESSILNARNRLREALRAAETLLKVRNRCRTIAQHATPTATIELSQGESVHVELYLDETGKRGGRITSVGGILAIFTGKNPANLANVFDDVAVGTGLRYFENCLHLKPDPANGPLDKRLHTGATQLKQAVNIFNRHRKGVHREQIRLGTVRVDLPEQTCPGEDDADYWRLIQNAIQIFLGESLREIADACEPKANKLTYSIFAGTRYAPIPSATGDAHFQYGFQIQDFSTDRERIRMARTFDKHDLYWIIEGVRPEMKQGHVCTRAIAVTLPYYKQASQFPKSVRCGRLLLELNQGVKPETFRKRVMSRFGLNAKSIDDCRYDYRALHYIADQWLRMPGHFEHILEKDAPGQFVETLNKALEGPSLRAARHLNRDDLARAIAEVDLPGHSGECASAMIYRRIAEGMKTELDGETIMRVHNLLAAEG